MAGERYAFKRIKSDAAAAKREFTINLEWFIEQCHLPCVYCGRSDQNMISVKSKAGGDRWIVKDFRYNGLDRLDNSLGYTKQNCVPCCAVCNRGKNSMGYNEWKEYLDALVKFNTQGEKSERNISDIRISDKRRVCETRNETKPEFKQGGYIRPSRGI